MSGANSDSYIGVPPTRFPGGVTNVDPFNPLHAYGAMDLTKYHVYFNDFEIYLASDWTVTNTGSGTEAVSTGADGGILVVTNAAADNDNQFLDYKIESWKLALGKKLWFKTRFKTSDATQTDIVIGLQITDTSPLAVADGVFFRKDDDAATMDFVVCKDATETKQTAVATLVDDTYIEAAFYWDGVDKIEVWIDGVKKVDAPTTNYPDDEELCVSFGIQNGVGVAKTMSLDYIFVARERG